MASELVDEKERTITNAGGGFTKTVSIPEGWIALLGLKECKVVTVALMKGKHGHFMAVYNKEFQIK